MTNGTLGRFKRICSRGKLASTLVFSLSLAVTACSVERPSGDSAKLSGGSDTARVRPPLQSGAAGQTAVGESCSWRGPIEIPGLPGSAYEILCGSWREPSARVFVVSDGDATAEAPWRDYVAARSQCEAPTSARILGNVPASVQSCTRRNGGFPTVALVASAAGRTYYGDGIKPAAGALEATIATLAGRGAAPRGGSLTDLLATQVVGQFGSGDVGRFDGLMRVASRYNIEENFAAAEDSYRDALALQQRLMGAQNPMQADPMMHLALQRSNRGAFEEADGLFDRVTALLAGSGQPLLSARLAHYRAIHASNQGRYNEALATAVDAEKAYLSVAPELLSAVSRKRGSTSAPPPILGLHRTSGVDPFSRTAVAAESLPDGVETPEVAQGLAELYRLRALIALGRDNADEARRMATVSNQVLRFAGIDPAAARSRVVRVSGLGAREQGDYVTATSELSSASRGIEGALPSTGLDARVKLDLGVTELRRGRLDAALAAFREGGEVLKEQVLRSQLLGEHRPSVDPTLVLAYLDALAREMQAKPAQSQTLATEMFEVAQLRSSGDFGGTQDSTGAVLGRAAIRLGAKDKGVQEYQQAEARMKDLYGRRDVLVLRGGDPATLASLDAEIAENETKRAAAEQVVQGALPQYTLLTRGLVTAKEVMAALRKDEGFVQIVLGPRGGYGILLAGGEVSAYRIDLTDAQAERMVTQLRRAFPSDATPTNLPAFDVQLAHDLYRRALGPVDGRLNSIKELIVSASGALQSIPFSILVTKPVNPVIGLADYQKVPWLARNLATSYVPEPRSLVLLRREASASRAPEPYVGFGDFQVPSVAAAIRGFSGMRRGVDSRVRGGIQVDCAADAAALSALAPLDYSEAEIRAAARIMGAQERSAVRLGAAFTRDAVIGGDLKRFRTIHFATHALMPSELACLDQPIIVPSILGSSTGYLTAEDIAGIQIDADLVILSACNTAAPSGRTDGEGFSGLVRSFFSAGARGVLASHWSVVDGTTALMIRNLLERSARSSSGDQSIADDLRRTQLSLLDFAGSSGAEAHWAHPRYWAPFVFAGITPAGSPVAAQVVR